jgi:hypothetical protein
MPKVLGAMIGVVYCMFVITIVEVLLRALT